jgi:hypothetical protein
LLVVTPVPVIRYSSSIKKNGLGFDYDILLGRELAEGN